MDMVLLHLRQQLEQKVTSKQSDHRLIAALRHVGIGNSRDDQVTPVTA